MEFLGFTQVIDEHYLKPKRRKIGLYKYVSFDKRAFDTTRSLLNVDPAHPSVDSL